MTLACISGPCEPGVFARRHPRAGVESMSTLRAVPIRAPFVDWILEGKKTWEIRSRNTNIRGTIGLIKSRSLTVVGVADIVDVVPLTRAIAQKNARSKMNQPPSDWA